MVETKAIIKRITALQIPGPIGIFNRQSNPMLAQKAGIDAIYIHNNFVRIAANEAFPYHLRGVKGRARGL